MLTVLNQVNLFDSGGKLLKVGDKVSFLIHNSNTPLVGILKNSLGTSILVRVGTKSYIGSSKEVTKV